MKNHTYREKAISKIQTALPKNTLYMICLSVKGKTAKTYLEMGVYDTNCLKNAFIKGFINTLASKEGPSLSYGSDVLPRCRANMLKGVAYERV